MLLSVIMPVYNEEKTILEIIDRVRNCGLDKLQLIIVDDCSTDGTRDKLAALPASENLTVLYHERNQGKGAAIATAQEHVKGEVMVIQDADLEYSPAEFVRMLPFIAEDKADAVFGSRYSGSTTLVDTFWHYYGNRIITGFFNLAANRHLTDMETCYKMIKADLFKSIKLKSKRFGFEPEIAAKLIRKGARIYEIPIEYAPRLSKHGKKIGWKDGVAAFWHIIRYCWLDRDV
ncbi:MAG: glycosyltransferase family 2 protein [Oligosphaeraceae bacterium]|nr:glycosyltransferase family 2 protein [Oligosphaeraceae bacterium]